MKALLFDPCHGAAGDMIMGCLLDLGASVDTVRETVESVGCDLKISREERGHIMATRARVISDRRYQSLKDAVSILRGSCLQGRAQEQAFRALDILANAESQVHGLPKEETRFHEIGALDALADIAGSCAALQSLGIERVLSRPVSAGAGSIHSEHGLLPVPGPAALEILRAYKIPWKGGPVDQELLTPTGAALLAALVQEFLADFPLIKAVQVGYGAGSRELPIPNILRGLTAEMASNQNMQEKDYAHNCDCVVQLETNVDDVTGEVLGYLIDQLMEAGALDASIIPALMKKGRSGNIIRAIVRQEDAEKISKIIIKETGSLGVRVFPSLHRFIAERKARTVEVEINHTTYQVAAKVSRMNGNLLNIKAEYEDCVRIAAATGLPLRKVIQKVEEEGWRAADS